MNQNMPNFSPAIMSQELYLSLQKAPVKTVHQCICSSELESRPYISSFERSSIIGFSTPLKNPISPFEIRFTSSLEKTKPQENTEAQKSHSTILVEKRTEVFEFEQKGKCGFELESSVDRKSPKVIDLLGFVSSRQMSESRAVFLKRNFGILCKLCGEVFQSSLDLRSHCEKKHKEDKDNEPEKGVLYRRKKIDKTRNDFLRKFTEN